MTSNGCHAQPGAKRAEDSNDAVLFEKIKTGRYDDGDPIWESISSGAKDLISKMLDIRVESRLGAAQCLQHPWLNEQAAILANAPEGAAMAPPNGKPQSVKQLASLSRMLSARSTQRTQVAKTALNDAAEADEVAALARHPLAAAAHSGVTRQGSNRIGLAPVSGVLHSDAQSRDRTDVQLAAAAAAAGQPDHCWPGEVGAGPPRTTAHPAPHEPGLGVRRTLSDGQKSGLSGDVNGVMLTANGHRSEGAAGEALRSGDGRLLAFQDAGGGGLEAAGLQDQPMPGSQEGSAADADSDGSRDLASFL